ncbi:MAG: hypothetical protein AAB049_07530, partial [Nitrospirota bacterium]
CLAAWQRKHGSQDPRAWSGSLSQAKRPASASTGYADGNLIRGIEQNSGRHALLTLEEIIRSRKGVGSSKGSTPANSPAISSS